jgi:hypothetical protein
MAVVLAATLIPAGAALADEPFNPDCHLQGINQGIDSVIAQIKSSPAYGHAGGHYANAIKDLERTKTQLHEGCHAWNKSLRR